MIRDLSLLRFCVFAIIAAVFMLAVSLTPLALTSCGARFSSADGGGTPPVLDGGESSYSNVGAHGVRPFGGGDNAGGENPASRGKPFDLFAVKAELENSPVPENADETVWDALGKAFIIELERAQSNRTANAAPKSNAGRVDDFHFDSSTGIVSWTYKNLGDYDLSGEVGVADITQIALNYGKTVEYDEDGKPAGDIDTPEGLENHRLAWIDGDKNGEIGISDVTPIALNYLNDVVEYAVVSADSATAPDNEWIELFRIIMPSDKTFPVRFEQMLPGGARNLVGVRSVGKDGSMGERSNLAAVITTVAPVIYGINLPTGVSGDFVLFSAVVTGTHPRFYEWNFGGGAEPNITNDALPTVTLGAIGWYDGRLTVTNEYGTAIRDFKYYIPGQPLQPPVAIAQAWPLGGDAPLEVTFLCKNSYSPNGTIVKYEWDFDSDGTYDWESEVPANTIHTYEGGMWQATLRVTDEAGQAATAETDWFNVFPNERWSLEEIPGSGTVQGAFDVPGEMLPAYAYGRYQSQRNYLGFWRKHILGHWVQQEYDVTDLPGGYFFAGTTIGGTLVFYSNTSNAIRMCEFYGGAYNIFIPAIPGGKNTVIDAAIGTMDEIHAIVEVENNITKAKEVFLSSWNGTSWMQEPIPAPNKSIREVYAAFPGGVACASTGNNIWFSYRDSDRWVSELVDVAPTQIEYTDVTILPVLADVGIIAEYYPGEGPNKVIYSERRDGHWTSQPLISHGDDDSAYPSRLKGFASPDGKLQGFVIFLDKPRLFRIYLHEETEWFRETVYVPFVSYLSSSAVYMDGKKDMHYFFNCDTEDGTRKFFYLARRYA